MQDLINQANHYKSTYEIMGRAHYLAADRAERFDKLLSITVIVITTAVGSTLFGDFFSVSTDTLLITIAGILSLVGALLTAIQTFLDLDKLTSRHETAAQGYRDISRRYKTYILRFSNAAPERRDEATDEMAKLDDRLIDIGQNSPRLPDSLYDRAVSENDELSEN